MATIKNTATALGNIINKILNPLTNPSYSGNNTLFGGKSNVGIAIDDDSIPVNMLTPEPIFTINYKSLKKQCCKKAKDSIEAIIKEVVPTQLQSSLLILNKLIQDYETLGNLYDSFEKGDKVVLACMDSISKGEVSPRMLEVFAKLLKSQNELSLQIVDTQNQMRKYYIDAYLDLLQKDETDANMALHGRSDNEQKVLEAPSSQKSDNENIIVGTDLTIKMLNERKKQAMMAKFLEVNDEKDSSN